MREMKKTTIPFCEYIPDKWQVLQNRYLFCNHSVKVGENYNDYQLLSLTTSGVKKKDINASGGKVPTSYDNYQTVSNGDMIFCLFDLDCSAVFSGLSSFEGMITSAYDVFKPEEKYVDKHYIEYWFQYVFSYRYYKMYSKSIRYTITSDMFKAITTPVPPIEEQRRIGEYLDSKCTQIDALISNAQQQIEKLKAYKQSVITEAVTKGLDPDVAMKDSGIDWIGSIPQNWIITKIKYVTDVSRGLFNHRPRNDARFYNGEYPFIQTGDVARAIKYITEYSQTLNENGIKVSKQFPKGTLTMTIAANVGDVAILGFDAYFPDSVVGFIPHSDCHGNYLYYIFRAMKDVFVNASIMNTQLNLNVERVKNLYMPFAATIAEQEKIANHLDRKCSQIDKLIALKQQKIEKLQQYKKSLIYEYVTGKKEV